MGKALLSQLPDERVKEILARTGMEPHTPNTLTSPEALLAELAQVREQGYAVDDEEQELGVRCVAVPLRGAPALTAISVSGPSGRMTREAVPGVVPIMQAAAERFARELAPNK